MERDLLDNVWRREDYGGWISDSKSLKGPRQKLELKMETAMLSMGCLIGSEFQTLDVQPSLEDKDHSSGWLGSQGGLWKTELGQSCRFPD